MLCNQLIAFNIDKRVYFAIFKMTNIHELRINIKIFVTLGKYLAETRIIIQIA